MKFNETVYYEEQEWIFGQKVSKLGKLAVIFKDFEYESGYFDTYLDCLKWSKLYVIFFLSCV
jgi:hypothetical protein